MPVGNLELITSVTVSSGVTTVDVDNVFSANYDVYFVQFVGIYQSTNVSNGIEGLRLIDNAGSVITASEYGYANLNMPSGSAFAENRFATRDFIFFGMYADQLSDGQANASMYIFNPYNSSSFTFLISQANGKNSSDFYGAKTIGVHQVAETIRGFQLYESDGTRTFGGGQINVYGVK
jgi:hypothetical protein